MIPTNNTTIGEKWPRPGQQPAADNPFVRVNGQIRSITTISKLVRDNPARAQTLCRLAGEPVERWFDTNPR